MRSKRKASGVAVVSAAFALIAVVAAGCSGASPSSGGVADGNAAPYAGYETRDIAALSPERTEQLLAGGGAGYALAAEVNGFPGPKHVLELAERLKLTEGQRSETEALYAEMNARAVELGGKLVELERELDRAFKSGAAKEETLARLTAAIAETEGELRYTHLATHLEMKALLTPEQTAAYAELRGYNNGNGGGDHEAHAHGGSH